LNLKLIKNGECMESDSLKLWKAGDYEIAIVKVIKPGKPFNGKACEEIVVQKVLPGVNELRMSLYSNEFVEVAVENLFPFQGEIN